MVGAKEAVFKSDIRGFADQLYMYEINKYSENKTKYDAKKLNSEEGEIWYDDEKTGEVIEEVISGLKGTEYKEKVFIEEGELVLDGFEITEKEIKWAEEIKIKVSFEKGVRKLALTSTYTEITAKVPVRWKNIIKEYEYTIYKITGEGKEEKKEKIETRIEKENEITFKGLIQDNLYEVEVNVKFKYSNKVIVERKGRIRTKKIEEPVKIEQSPQAITASGEINWTSGNVIATLTHRDILEGYVLQYRVGESTDWITGNIVEVNKNNTLVRGRLYNEEQDDEIAVNARVISNIDKEKPTAPTNVSISVGTNTVTALATGSIDNLSGINKYQYSLDNSTWQDSGTFNGIKSGTDTTVYARAVDKVGNVSESTSNKGTTNSIGKVTITPSITSWTSGNVTVTLTHNSIPSGYVLQYKTGSQGNWANYTEALTISNNNTTVAARLYNKALDDEGNSANSRTISNIDKGKPTAPTNVSISVGTNTVTALATGSIDNLSGINKYQYSLDNSTWQDSGTFNGIKSGTDTTVYARAVDKVGNVSESTSNKGTTNSIGKVTITPSITSWTSGNVTVTLSHNSIPSGYVLQYKTGSQGNWANYTEALTISNNNTTVAARLYNKALDDEGNSANSRTISNIDKTSPTIYNVLASTTSWTNGNVTLTGVATESQSGIVAYQFSTNSGLTASSSGWNTITATSTLEKTHVVSSNGTYYFYVKDAVGNVNKKSIKISNIDKTAPTINTALSSTSQTINSISLSINVTDTNPGISKIIWYYKVSSASGSYSSTTDTYKTMNGSEEGTKTAVTKTKTLSNLAKGTKYNIYAVVYDVAGNARTSSTIAVETYAELRDANDDIKTKYNFNGSTTQSGPGYGSGVLVLADSLSNTGKYNAGNIVYISNQATYGAGGSGEVTLSAGYYHLVARYNSNSSTLSTSSGQAWYKIYLGQSYQIKSTTHTAIELNDKNVNNTIKTKYNFYGTVTQSSPGYGYSTLMLSQSTDIANIKVGQIVYVSNKGTYGTPGGSGYTELPIGYYLITAKVSHGLYYSYMGASFKVYQ